MFGDSIPEKIEYYSGLNGKVKRPTRIQQFAIPVIQNRRSLIYCSSTSQLTNISEFLEPIVKVLLKEKQSLEVGKPNVVIVSPNHEWAKQVCL